MPPETSHCNRNELHLLYTRNSALSYRKPTNYFSNIKTTSIINYLIPDKVCKQNEQRHKCYVNYELKLLFGKLDDIFENIN